MHKKISVTELRNQLGNLLDLLGQGQSHFVIERNNQEVAVLLSMEKFQDIMQMLELLNTLDFIDAGGVDLSQDFLEGHSPSFPDLTLLRPNREPQPRKTDEESRLRERGGSSIEDVAARLGIRVIK